MKDNLVSFGSVSMPKPHFMNNDADNPIFALITFGVLRMTEQWTVNTRRIKWLHRSLCHFAHSTSNVHDSVPISDGCVHFCDGDDNETAETAN